MEASLYAEKSNSTTTSKGTILNNLSTFVYYTVEILTVIGLLVVWQNQQFNRKAINPRCLLIFP